MSSYSIISFIPRVAGPVTFQDQCLFSPADSSGSLSRVVNAWCSQRLRLPEHIRAAGCKTLLLTTHPPRVWRRCALVPFLSARSSPITTAKRTMPTPAWCPSSCTTWPRCSAARRSSSPTGSSSCESPTCRACSAWGPASKTPWPPFGGESWSPWRICTKVLWWHLSHSSHCTFFFFFNIVLRCIWAFKQSNKLIRLWCSPRAAGKRWDLEKLRLCHHLYLEAKG